MSDDKQAKVANFTALQQQIEQFSQHLELLAQRVEELSVTQASLGDFEKLKEEKTSFVSLAPGIFVEGKISGNSDVLINVGSSIAVKKPATEVAKILGKEVESLKQEELRVTNLLQELVDKTEKMYVEMQKEENV